MTPLPGGVSRHQLEQDLRNHLRRPELVLDALDCRPLRHRITAPTTAGLTRVRAEHSDASGRGTTDLVVKELQAARHGLPPHLPSEARAHLDRLIPWRLEAEVYRSDLTARMPPELALPGVLALHEHGDDRLTLWMTDADPVGTAWTCADVARAATGLGRLAARRAAEPPLGPVDLVTSYRDNQLGAWAVPRLLADQIWDHPLFRLPEIAALRRELTELAGRVHAVHAGLADLPLLPAHGDATPMNLLRPRTSSEGFVLIDWGMAAHAPVGFDVVPLVFGRAEDGSAPPDEVPGLLDTAVRAYTAGLAVEGLHVPQDDVRRAVVTTALLRYPCTGVPLDALDGPPVDAAKAVAKAGFVRMVLDLGREYLAREPA